MKLVKQNSLWQVEWHIMSENVLVDHFYLYFVIIS